MSIKNAWLGLIGKESTVYLVGSVSKEVIYKVEEVDYIGWFPYSSLRDYFATCEQAHANHPGKTVVAIEALRIDKELFILPASARLERVVLQPKPKVAKGRK